MSDGLTAHSADLHTNGAAGGLEVKDLVAGYHGQPVVFGVDLRAAQGRVTAIFGHNGAGKSTILRTCAGLVARLGGTVLVCGIDVSSRPPRDRFRSGVIYLPQDQATFPGLTVGENLEIGALGCNRAEKRSRLDHVFDVFPQLAGRQHDRARVLSGGQQRMLSIGAALMADAKVLLLDEPSLGLAPALTQTLLLQVQKLAQEEQRTIVLVEQAIGQALPIVDYVYVIRSGSVIAQMSRADALRRSDWTDVY